VLDFFKENRDVNAWKLSIFFGVVSKLSFF